MKSVLPFLVLLAGLRLVLLFATLDPVEEWVMEVFDTTEVVWEHGPERPLYDREELYTGTAAQAMREGLPIPFSKYQFMDYGGGSLLTSFLAAGLYSVFGPNYLAFKIIPFAVTLLGGLFWVLIARAWFGQAVASLFALLYLFAPSTFVRTIWIAKGDHSEAMMWIGLVLWLFTRALIRERASAAGRFLGWAFWGGIAAGFGVFVTYSTVPVTFGILGAALILTRMQPRRLWIQSGAGLGIGLIPWIVGLFTTKGSALEVYGQTLGSMGARLGERAATMFNTGFFAGYDLPAMIRPFAGLVFLVVVVIAWVHIVRRVSTSGEDRTRRLGLGLLLVGTAAHLLAFILGAPDTASRYLMPLYPLLLLAVANLAGSAAKARPIALLPMAVVLLGAGSLFFSVAGGHWTARSLPLHGVDWPLLGEVVGQKLSQDEIAAIPSKYRRHFLVGFGKKVFAAVDQDRWTEAADLFRTRDQLAVWEGVGIAWVESGQVLEAGPVLESLSPEAQQGLIAGMARYGEVVFGPLLTSDQPIDFPTVQARMAGSRAGELNTTRARVWATLARQGYDGENAAWAQAGRGLSAPQVQTAVGSASFRSIRRNQIEVFPDRGDMGVATNTPGYRAGLAGSLDRLLAATTLTPEEQAERRAKILEGSAGPR